MELLEFNFFLLQNSERNSIDIQKAKLEAEKLHLSNLSSFAKAAVTGKNDPKLIIRPQLKSNPLSSFGIASNAQSFPPGINVQGATNGYNPYQQVINHF